MDLKEWREAALAHLSEANADGRAATDFIRARGTRIGFRVQNQATAALWTLGGGIYLNPLYYSLDTPPNHPRLLALIAHEARHLQQGLLTALSVYGELEAWQVDFRIYRELSGSSLAPALDELLSLPLAFDRAILRRACDLMQAYSGKGYRIDLLPLYPLPQEIRFWLGLLPPARA